jgi:YHS domain-containing protein
MLRALIYTLLGVLVLTFVRAVIGILTKGVADLFKEEAEQMRAGGGEKKGEFGGELVKDPVCGTFVSAKSPHTKTVAGKVYCFCSETCRDKFAA